MRFGPWEFCQLSCAARRRGNPASSLQWELILSPAYAMDAVARGWPRIATGSDALKITCRRDVRLKQLGPERDRYERLVAFVQQVLLEQGQARVSVRIGGKACADVLLSAERTAGKSHRSRSPTPISPSCSQKTLPDCGCAGSICASRRKGLVGAGKRHHNIFKSRTALDPRLYRHHSQASSAGIYRRGHRSEPAGGSSNSGTRLDRTAQRSRDQDRGV